MPSMPLGCICSCRFFAAWTLKLPRKVADCAEVILPAFVFFEGPSTRFGAVATLLGGLGL